MRGSQISQQLPLTQEAVVINDSKMLEVKLKTLVHTKIEAKRRRKEVVIKAKKWKAKEFLLGTATGQFVGLTILAIVLIVLGAFAWIWTGGTDDYEANFREGLWLSWGVFFDPGTQTGLSSSEQLGPQIVAVLFSIAGFMFNLVALGIIVDVVRAQLEQWKALYGRLVLNNHIVVLGWTDKTVFLLTELAMMLNGNQTQKRVVVLGDRPLETMLLEVETNLPKFRHRIDLVQGKPFEVDSLDRVCIETASVVLLLGASKQPEIADSLSVTTLLALHALPVAPKALLIAELQLAQSVDVVSGIFGTGRMSFEVIGVNTSIIADQAMALLASQPAAGICLVEFCDQFGDDLNVSESVAELELVNQRFSRASALPRFRHAVVFGIVSERGFLTLAPEPDRKLQPTDRLILINADEKQAELAESTISSMRGGSGCCSFLKNKIEPPPMLVKCRDRVRGMPYVCPDDGPPRVVIIIGWGPCISSLLRSLDARLPCKSKLVIFSSTSMEARAQELKADGMGENKEGLSQVTIEHVIGRTTLQVDLALLPLEDASAVLVIGDAQTKGGQNAQITDSETIMTVEFLQQLRAQAELDSKMLEDEQPTDEELKEDKKRWKSGKQRSNLAKTATNQTSKTLPLQPFVIVPQFQDWLTLRMFRRDNKLLNTASSRHHMKVIPFHRNAVETGVLTVSAQLPALGRALEAIAGLEVRVRDQQGALKVSLKALNVQECLKPHEVVKQNNGTSSINPVSVSGLSFDDLSKRAAEEGHGVVLGWARTNGHPQVYDSNRGPGDDQPGITVNPREKDKRHKWYAGDQILVMTAKDSRPAPPEAVTNGVGATLMGKRDTE